MQDVDIASLDPRRFDDFLEPSMQRRFAAALERTSVLLRDRTLWHLNSTAQGGGVAEMLQSLLGYLVGAGIPTRWMVIEGDEEFFEVTKSVHNLLHGEPGEDARLGREHRRVYEGTLRTNLRELNGLVGPDDVVVLHDPQTVGLAPSLREAGARVVWSCHVGVDEPNHLARQAWSFLRPYVDAADAHVFSRPAYVWDGLDPDTVEVIPPCVDAFSPKNQALDAGTVRAILDASGMVVDGAQRTPEPRFERQDGTAGVVARRVAFEDGRPVPDAVRIVAQVSRWDRLKDPIGVLRGFVRHVDADPPAHLVLAGPAPTSTADDPEAEEVLGEVRSAWRELAADDRERVHLASVPMEDVEENAAIVNALQRRADVVVQKSVAEGFGLTVAEAMWKERPVVASRVGGIQDQIVHGQSGLLVDDPEDLPAFGDAVTTLLEDPERATMMGKEAHARVRDEYLAPVYLTRSLELIDRIHRQAASRS